LELAREEKVSVFFTEERERENKKLSGDPKYLRLLDRIHGILQKAPKTQQSENESRKITIEGYGSVSVRL
jgi:hypothetical protein